MNGKVVLIALVACAILVAGTEACGGEGRSESGRCGGSEGTQRASSTRGAAGKRDCCPLRWNFWPLRWLVAPQETSVARLQDSLLQTLLFMQELSLS
ncbi:hypothetical protein MTO96_029739 [Rhipicephalus appendiculatus]